MDAAQLSAPPKALLGLPEAVARPMLELLCPQPMKTQAKVENCDDQHELLTARLLWSCVAESGDAIANGLIHALGPVAAARALIEAPSMGDFAQTAARVLAYSGTDGEVQELKAAAQRFRARLSQRSLLETMERTLLLGAQVLIPEQDLWPCPVSDLRLHQPFLLWSQAKAERLKTLGAESHKPLAIVGSRTATGYGEHMTVELAAGLALKNHPVISGAAYGIDGMAHRAVLRAGGLTAAVLAGGIDQYYPSGHSQLLQQIATEGAVLAESPPGTQPTKWRFLQRNRLIAALGAATVVVEAGFRSGSINTAAHAASLHRPIGAVPGPATSANSAGCHRLLREYQAICVTSVAEALELLGEDS